MAGLSYGGLGLKTPEMGDWGLNWMSPEQRANFVGTPTITPAGSVVNGSSDLWGAMKDIPLGSIISGIGTLGNLWGSSRALGLARDQFNFQKDFANTNLVNQIKSYNTALEDRARSRAAVEGQSQDVAQAYIDKNRLTR